MIKRSLAVVSIIALAAAGMILAGCNKAETPAPVVEVKSEWLTDYPKAQALAKEANKAILLDFTGSDFCIGCQSLKKQVWSTPEFAEFAKKNLVLVELDFPMDLPQPEELKKANQALESQFKVVGYPTIIMVDASGKEIFRDEGYDDSPANKYIAKLRDALTKR